MAEIFKNNNKKKWAEWQTLQTMVKFLLKDVVFFDYGSSWTFLY